MPERAIEEAKRKKLGWMIVGEGGVAEAGSLDALGRSLRVLKPWEKLELQGRSA